MTLADNFEICLTKKHFEPKDLVLGCRNIEEASLKNEEIILNHEGIARKNFCSVKFLPHRFCLLPGAERRNHHASKPFLGI